MPSSSRRSRRSVQVRALGKRFFARPSRCSSGSQSPPIVTPSIFSNEPIRPLARPPQLMKPTLISSLALAAQSERAGVAKATPPNSPAFTRSRRVMPAMTCCPFLLTVLLTAASRPLPQPGTTPKTSAQGYRLVSSRSTSSRPRDGRRQLHAAALPCAYDPPRAPPAGQASEGFSVRAAAGQPSGAGHRASGCGRCGRRQTAGRSLPELPSWQHQSESLRPSPAHPPRPRP